MNRYRKPANPRDIALTLYALAGIPPLAAARRYAMAQARGRKRAQRLARTGP